MYIDAFYFTPTRYITRMPRLRGVAVKDGWRRMAVLVEGATRNLQTTSVPHSHLDKIRQHFPMYFASPTLKRGHMAALIAVGSVGCVLTSSQQLVAPLLLLPVLENTPAKPVEGLTGRQARAGETMEKPLARKLVNPPQVFSSTSPSSWASSEVL
jgi:hypothetical protein